MRGLASDRSALASGAGGATCAALIVVALESVRATSPTTSLLGAAGQLAGAVPEVLGPTLGLAAAVGPIAAWVGVRAASWAGGTGRRERRSLPGPDEAPVADAPSRLAVLASSAAAAIGVAAQVFLVWDTVQSPGVRWSLVVWAGFGAVATALAAARVLGLRSGASPRVPRALGLALLLGGALIATAHHAALVGVYPTVHQAALELAVVTLALGSETLIASFSRARVSGAFPGHSAADGGAGPLKPSGQRGRRIAPPWVAAASVLGVGLAVSAASMVVPLDPRVASRTELGRAASVARAFARDSDHLLPTSLPGPRDPAGPLRPDPDARRRFDAHSGLPPLGDVDVDRDVLVVLADAARADDAEALPNLRRLAHAGQRFTRAYSPSNGTFPSLAAMLQMVPLSLADVDVQPRFWRGALRPAAERPRRPTAAEAMRADGRATFWVGHDHRGCFSENIRGLESGFDERILVPQERGDPEGAAADARIADAAIAAIARRRSEGRRYFGLVFFVSPHDDYQAHPRLGGDASSERGRYRQELAYTDRQLGRVLDALEADGALDETVVVFAGDHGEAFGERGHRHHLTSVHAEQVRVPLVARVPGLPAAVHGAPTSTAYVLPWLLSRAGPRAREAASGALRRDVGPWMRELDGAVVSEMIGPRRQAVALHTAAHSVVHDLLTGLVRVYDAEDDPHEARDLREARPDLLERLTPLVSDYRRARFAGRRFRFTGAPP